MRLFPHHCPSFHFIEYLPSAADSVEEYCCKILCNFQE
jgi:hypothetical protein